MRTLKIAGIDTLFTVRPFTEDAAIAYLDKEAASLSENERISDYMDDGDEEILGAIVSPDRALVEQLIEYAPGVTRLLAKEIMSLTMGSGVKIEEIDSWSEDPPHTIRYLVTDDEGVRYVRVKRISRAQYKFLLHSKETKQAKRLSYKALSGIAKANTIDPPTGIWQRYPTLSVVLGELLYAAAVPRVEKTEGK